MTRFTARHAGRLAAACTLALAAMSAQAATTLTIAALNNPDMVELKKLSPALHQAELGSAGRKRAAPARHHRHRHQ